MENWWKDYMHGNEWKTIFTCNTKCVQYYAAIIALNASRFFENVSWAVMNDSSYYDDSLPIIHLQIMYWTYWIGYSVSLAFLLIAVTIFISYKGLWCDRNMIHTNLILCFAFHNLVWILYSFTLEVATIDPSNKLLCSLPTSVLKYFIAAGFFWMFIEGFYLLINVLYSFHAHKIRFWMCAIFAWGIPLFLIFATNIVRATDNGHLCFGDEQKHYLDYIFLAPILFLLVINVAFLILIMHVIFSKLRITERAEMRRYTKALRALLILCPLLGVNYLLVLFQPSQPLWLYLIFGYYTTLVSSTQGILIALLFCFRNSEVLHVLHLSYRTWKANRTRMSSIGSSHTRLLFLSTNPQQPTARV